MPHSTSLSLPCAAIVCLHTMTKWPCIQCCKGKGHPLIREWRYREDSRHTVLPRLVEVVNATLRPLYLRGKRRVTHCTGGWVGHRGSHEGSGEEKNNFPFEVRIQKSPVCCDSLNQLCYTDPQSVLWLVCIYSPWLCVTSKLQPV